MPGGRLGGMPDAALYSGHESILQLLLDKGADANIPGRAHVCLGILKLVRIMEYVTSRSKF